MASVGPLSLLLMLAGDRSPCIQPVPCLFHRGKALNLLNLLILCSCLAVFVKVC